MAAPPHMCPRPPWKGIMKGSSFSGGSSDQAGGAPVPRLLPPPPEPGLPGNDVGGLLPVVALCSGVSGVARPCSRASDTGWSHRLGSGATPAASMCAANLSYCVLYGAICDVAPRAQRAVFEPHGRQAYIITEQALMQRRSTLQAGALSTGGLA